MATGTRVHNLTSFGCDPHRAKLERASAMSAHAGDSRCEKIANKKLLHCLNNDGVIIIHKNQHDRDASFKL